MNIHIPTPLRVYSDKQDTVSVNATTVGEALDALTAKHPDLKKHLYSEEGKLRSFVNIYLNDEDIRYLPEKESTKVGDKDALYLAVLEWVYEEIRAQERKLNLEGLPPEQAIKKLIESSFDHLAAHPDFIVLLNDDNRGGAQWLRLRLCIH